MGAQIEALRDGKAALRHRRRGATLEQKLQDLVRLQHLYVQIVGTRRPLKPLERPWALREDDVVEIPLPTPEADTKA